VNGAAGVVVRNVSGWYAVFSTLLCDEFDEIKKPFFFPILKY